MSVLAQQDNSFLAKRSFEARKTIGFGMKPATSCHWMRMKRCTFGETHIDSSQLSFETGVGVRR